MLLENGFSQSRYEEEEGKSRKFSQSKMNRLKREKREVKT
jgi:hypothetical protein